MAAAPIIRALLSMAARADPGQFRRLDSNQNDELQRLTGCQLPHAGACRTPPVPLAPSLRYRPGRQGPLSRALPGSAARSRASFRPAGAVALPPPGVSARWGLTAPVPLWQVTGIGWGPGSQAGNLGNGGRGVRVRPERGFAPPVSEYENRLGTSVAPSSPLTRRASRR